ncbi:hypothetical protein NDU88_003657, partial [Pleurodeles waltl]
YGFSIVHDFAQIWSERGFLTSSCSPVRNGEKINELFKSVQKPEKIAVVKCSAHQRSQVYVSLGNAYADQVAKYCALNGIYFKGNWELLPENDEAYTHFTSQIINTLEELKAL